MKLAKKTLVPLASIGRSGLKDFNHVSTVTLSPQQELAFEALAKYCKYMRKVEIGRATLNSNSMYVEGVFPQTAAEAVAMLAKAPEGAYCCAFKGYTVSWLFSRLAEVPSHLCVTHALKMAGVAPMKGWV